MPLLRPRLLLPWVALSAGLLALGSKLALISSCGSDLPYMDEWNAVGTELLVPASRHALGAANFLAPQNEHRVALSRLLSYALLRANGQWDGLLEMAVNAVVHAALLTALVAFARRLLTGASFAAAVVLSVLLFALPFDWENTLQGFQSQFYLLEWTALLALLGLAPSRPLSARWWLGWGAALLGLATMSSGFIAPLAAALVLVLRGLLSRGIGGRHLAALLLLGALCALGLAGVARVPGHEVLHAHTAGEWISAAAHGLSWPELSIPLAFLVLQLPLAALVWRRVREGRLEGDEAVLVGLGLWALLQVAALAYGRANQGMMESPRYSDLYAVGCFANLLSLGILVRPGPSRRAWGLLSVLWLCAFLCGLSTAVSHATGDYLPDFGRLKPLERAHVKAFLATGDRAALSAAPPRELRFPRADALADLLSEPAVRSVLPAGVRPALRTEPESDSAGFTVTADPLTGERTWSASRGPARFVGPAFPVAVLPYVRIAVSGSPDLDDAAVRLEPADTGGDERPAPLPAQGWRVRELPVPSGGSAHLVVELPPGAHALSFTEPVEVGRLSWLAHWTLRRSGALAATGAILLAVALALLLIGEIRRPPADGPVTVP